MIIGGILLKTGTGEEVEGVVAELNTWIQIAADTYFKKHFHFSFLYFEKWKWF